MSPRGKLHKFSCFLLSIGGAMIIVPWLSGLSSQRDLALIAGLGLPVTVAGLLLWIINEVREESCDN